MVSLFIRLPSVIMKGVEISFEKIVFRNKDRINKIYTGERNIIVRFSDPHLLLNKTDSLLK